MSKQIILLVRNAAKNDFGGAETYPVSLALLLKESKKYHPIVVSRQARLLEHAQNNHIQTIRGWWWPWQNWNGKYVLLFPLYVLWQFVLTCWYISLLLRTRATAIHLQSKDDFIAGTLAARLLGRTSVWTDHMDLRYIFENVSVPFKNPLGKLVLHCAKLTNHIIIISNNEHKLITSQFANPRLLKKQITIIKNGVIDTRNTLTKTPHSNKEIHLCMTNRMTVGKGVGDAIEAFMLLDDSRLHLNLYGDGPDLETFRTQSQNHPRIHFHGHTNNPLQAKYDADIFLAPSYQEGLSISLLESTMLGCTIIASDVDSNPEVIQHQLNGLLVPPRQPKALAQAIKFLVDNPKLRKQYGSAARNTYEKGFNLATIVDQKITPLYNSRQK